MRRLWSLGGLMPDLGGIYGENFGVAVYVGWEGRSRQGIC